MSTSKQRPALPCPPSDPRWRLQDAKARFSELVRRARAGQPQRVTLHGKDAVVVVAAEIYDEASARHTGRRLVEAMMAAPLPDVGLDMEPPEPGPVRDVAL